MKTVGEIVREYFPDASDDFIEYVTWGETGYPCFWNIPKDGNTPEECFRTQLKRFRHALYMRKWRKKCNIRV